MEMVITLEGKATVKANFKRHCITTDQPAPGGGDAAPTPFDLFLASIGTCAGFYVKSFCDQRNIPTNEIRLIQNMTVDPNTKMITSIDVKICLPPDFPDKYKMAVINAAELCTVKKHLHNPPLITISAS